RPAVAAAPPRLVVAPPVATVVERPAARVERRRSSATATQLRRQLRQVDRQLFEKGAATAPVPVADGSTGRSRRASIAAGLTAGLALVAFGEYLHHQRGSALEARNPAPTELARHTDAESFVASRPLTPALSAADALPPSAVGASRLATDVELPSRRLVHTSQRTAAGVPDQSSFQPPGDAVVVQSVDSQLRPVFSPAFASNGTALFFPTGRPNARSALGSLQGASTDLRVMTIVDEGSRNYHVQPSPDGRLIAFDSDCD